MKLIANDMMIENESLVKQDSKPVKFGWKIFSTVYSVWLMISIILSYANPQKYSASLTDLPNWLTSISPFVKSMIYLAAFIPVILLTICFALYILLFVMHNFPEKK